MDISEVFPKDGHIQHLYCDECGGYLDLTFRQFDENVSSIHIRIDGLPYLSCEKCNTHYLPDDSRFAIIYLHEQATKKKSDVVNVTRNKTNIDYELTNVPFLYDSDDYKYIPGLKRPFDEGFLTPVYFNREVLLKYDASPTYRLSQRRVGKAQRAHADTAPVAACGSSKPRQNRAGTALWPLPALR